VHDAVTLKDVARESSYSVSVVSFVLSGQKDRHYRSVSSDAREDILKVAAALGYVHRPRGRRKDAQWLPEPPPSPFAPRCIHGIDGGCEPCASFVSDLARVTRRAALLVTGGGNG
jgi:hypothetical protein